jgi:Uma2 family endonuclease
MNLPQSYIPHYTYTDYVQWEGRWELICGVPHAMSPAPNFRHQILASNLSWFLKNSFLSYPDVVIVQPIDFVPREDVVLQPDVAVFFKPVTEPQKITVVPEIVFEILSPSTAMKDRNPKFDLYEQAGVCYYVLVEPVEQTIEVFERREEKFYALHPIGEYTYTMNLPVGTVEIDFSPIWN